MLLYSSLGGEQCALDDRRQFIVHTAINRIVGPIAFGLAFIAIEGGVNLAWSDQGLTGQIRVTFTEASMRSCLKNQIDAPGNTGVLVSVLYEYCKCYSNGMADRISNDEARTLETNGSPEKYRAALSSRAQDVGKLCVESVRKRLLKPN
jgi:hypothetical protein